MGLHPAVNSEDRVHYGAVWCPMTVLVGNVPSAVVPALVGPITNTSPVCSRVKRSTSDQTAVKTKHVNPLFFCTRIYPVRGTEKRNCCKNYHHNRALNTTRKRKYVTQHSAYQANARNEIFPRSQSTFTSILCLLRAADLKA